MTDQRQEGHLIRRRQDGLRLVNPLRLLQRGVLIITLAAVLPLQPLTPRANAGGIFNPLSLVRGAARVISGLNHRNRVYRSSEQFISDRKAYYDGLRETARQQLLQREILGLRKSQTASYVKLVGLIERDRKVELDVAESRKRAARAEFQDTLGRTTLYVLAGSKLASRLIGALQKGVGKAQNALQRVLGTITSAGTSGLQDLQRIRQIAQQVSWAAGAIGGKPGRQLREASNRILRAIDRPQEQALAALEGLQDELANVSQMLDRLEQAGRTPSAGEIVDRVVARYLPDGSSAGDESSDAVSDILSQLESGDNSLRDEARAALREGFVARCAAIAGAYKANLTALQSDEGASSDGQGTTTCQAVKEGDLTRRAEVDEAEFGPDTAVTEEPTKEVLPLVSTEGDFPEQYTGSAYPDPMATSFTLVANFAAATVTGTLTGGRTIGDVPMPCGSDEVVVDTAYAEYTASYTASFSTTLDPETGNFSASISPAGSCSARYTQPYTVEGCTQFNSEPVPGCNPWSGQGTISGFVNKDGYIEFTTQWTTGGGSSAAGSWNGGGTVTTP
jgi:hypothetical protein